MGWHGRRWTRWVPVVLVGLVAACVPAPVHGPVGQIVAEGIIVCPPPTARCELSGATLAGGRLLVVNDRAVAGKASDSILALASLGFAPRMEAQFLRGLPSISAEKFEAITTTPDGRHVFATTAFDRHDPATPAQDHFNVLLTWPAERPQAVRVLGAAPDKPGASLALRQQVRAALASPSAPEGPAHFKIEGLAALPDRLLIGIRETGPSYRDVRFTLTVLSLPWHVENGRPALSGAPRVVWRVDPAGLRGLPKTPVGLSDLVYDAARDRLWLLTSFERDDDAIDAVAGYLWVLDRTALERGAPPVLVRDSSGKPLMFTHKPEALAVLPDRRLLIVHDDDRRATLVPDPVSGGQRPRQQTEALYQILVVDGVP
ncbi:MAG TPA: hypothetical protein VJR58_23210 [Vineibacter sp.]|nr:hypothetical protein [Vineibacter sp.]